MNFRISRHAKRRIRLYDISESLIIGLIGDLNSYEDGRYEIVRDAEGFTYPIKIVFEIQDVVVTLITAYPLKKGVQK